MADAPIAITGATGFLGQALLDAARIERIAVRALARRPQPDSAGVTWIAGDLADSAGLADMCCGTQAVIHAAGLVNAADPAGFTQANVAGTAQVIAAARAAGVQRLIFVSSLAAREPGLSAYGGSKAQAEQLVMASGLDWTIVRPPTIYGPRDRELLELFRAARWGMVPMPPPGRSSIIHAADLAALLLALIPADAPAAQRSFEPDDGTPGGWSHGELARAIGAAMGRRVLVWHLPARAMRWAARADRALRGSGAKLTLDRVNYMTHSDWVVSDAARVPPVLWQSRIPTHEGLAATAQWYREQGWL